jgi:acylphosphatase
LKAIHAFVRGRVQAVGYRQSCRQTARALGLVGWVRNVGDGGVEVFAQGAPESVDQLVEWLWSGPGPARVIGVETDTVAIDATLRDFFIQPDPAKDH